MISVLIPTRGRPEGFKRFKESANAILNVGLQSDDPKRYEYNLITCFMFDNIGLVKKTNKMLSVALSRKDADEDRKDDYFFGADDIEIITPDWKEIFSKKIDELEKEHGHRLWILYGDDGIQGEHLPTHPLMTNELCRLLGWFWPPHFKHLFTDNAIKFIGQGAGILRYVPEVKMTHHHFVNNKAPMDANYQETNNAHAYQSAKQVFEMWKEQFAPKIIEKIKLNSKK